MSLIKKIIAPILLIGLLLPALAVRAQSTSSDAGVAQPVQQTPASPTRPTISDNICRGVIGTETGTVNKSITVSDCSESESQSFGGLVRRIINIFSIVVGSVSVIMIIIGGFRYIISGGDSAGVSAAKNTILYAIVGLVIVLFSQIIIRFVISNFKPS